MTTSECRIGKIIAVLLKEYLGNLRVRKYSPKTLDVHDRAVKDFSRFLAGQEVTDLCNLRHEDLVRYRLHLVDRNFKPASIEVYLRAVKRFLGYLEEQQHIFLNPAEHMRMKQAERSLLPVPTEEDMERLMQAPDTSKNRGIRDRALLETAYGTGARSGEIISLRVESLNLDEHTVRLFGKGSRERVVPLGRSAAEWLGRYLRVARPALLKKKQVDALWIGFNQTPLGSQSIGVLMRTYGKKAGLQIRINPHSLRRACVTHMLRRGADPISIQQLLGHASLKTLGCYLRVSITEVKAMHEKTRPGRR